MSLDDIAEVLAGPGHNRRWHAILRTRITALEAKIVELRDAADLLEHILDHHPDEAPTAALTTSTSSSARSRCRSGRADAPIW